jgi:hypothetical protein
MKRSQNITHAVIILLVVAVVAWWCIRGIANSDYL